MKWTQNPFDGLSPSTDWNWHVGVGASPLPVATLFPHHSVHHPQHNQRVRIKILHGYCRLTRTANFCLTEHGCEQLVFESKFFCIALSPLISTPTCMMKAYLQRKHWYHDHQEDHQNRPWPFPFPPPSAPEENSAQPNLVHPKVEHRK